MSEPPNVVPFRRDKGRAERIAVPGRLPVRLVQAHAPDNCETKQVRSSCHYRNLVPTPSDGPLLGNHGREILKRLLSAHALGCGAKQNNLVIEQLRYRFHILRSDCLLKSSQDITCDLDSSHWGIMPRG